MSLTRRVLVPGLAWIFLQASLLPTCARDAPDTHVPAVVVSYMRMLSEIVHWRMRNTPYLIRSGGVATMAFEVSRSGAVSGSKIAKSSGSASVDALAKAAIPSGYRFPPFPPELGVDRLKVRVPLRFEAIP